MSKTTQPETQESLNDALKSSREEAQRIQGEISRMSGAHASDAKGVHALGMQRARLNAELADAHRREGAAEIAVLRNQHAAARIREEAAPGELAAAESALEEATRAAEGSKQVRDTAERAVLAVLAAQGQRQALMRQLEVRLSILGAGVTGATPARQPVAVAPARR